MIAKAIKTEHPRPRPLHLTVEHFFKGYPGLSMLVAKLGGVPAHPANVHRLLYDEEQLVLVFPEGRKGTEKLYKDRYRLRRFGRGGFVESAMRAKAPIVPVARRRRRGGDAGLRATSTRCKKLTGPDLLPDHADVPAGSACSAASATCRRSSSSASWSRSRPTSGARSRGTTRASCRPSPRRSAPASRRSSTRCSPTAGRSGSDEAPRPHHRPLAATGAAGSRRSSRRDADDRGDHRRLAPTTRRCALERTEYVRVGTQHALLRRIVHAARDRHRRRHPPDRRLARPRPPRVAHEHERDRDDEHPRGLRRARTRRCTKVVFKS